jgi:nucleoside-diphosphate-sugar epimerase
MASSGASSATESPQRILVTGGTGFIGSHLTRRLLTLGHEVLVVDNFYSSTRRNLHDLLGEPLPPDDPARRQPDITLAGELLDWSPTTPLTDGLRPTVEYFQEILAGERDVVTALH